MKRHIRFAFIAAILLFSFAFASVGCSLLTLKSSPSKKTAVEQVVLNEKQQALADLILSNVNTWKTYHNDVHGNIECCSLALVEYNGNYYLRGTYNTEMKQTSSSSSFGKAGYSYSYIYRITETSIVGRLSLDEANSVEYRGTSLGSVSVNPSGSNSELRSKIETLASRYK
jgi:hypothetical protein